MSKVVGYHFHFLIFTYMTFYPPTANRKVPVVSDAVCSGKQFCGITLIVIVNSRFLQRPQKRSRGNQLIHRHFSRKKSTDREIKIQRVRQAGRESDRYAGWCLELRQGGWYGEEDESVQDLMKSSVFSFE